MPSRSDIRPISVTTPTITRVKEMKAITGSKSYEALINHLIDYYKGIVSGGQNAK